MNSIRMRCPKCGMSFRNAAHDECRPVAHIDTSERQAAVEAWARYCRRFRLHPDDVIGMTFPGHEKYPVNEIMAFEIAMAMSVPQGLNHG